MKIKKYNLLSYAISISFLIYWGGIFLLAATSSKTKEQWLNRFPQTTMLFYQNWALFSPPAEYDFRLYFILRDTVNNKAADTLELYGSNLLQKQKKAPFNQRENLIDMLLFWNIKKINSAHLNAAYWLQIAFPDSSENYLSEKTISKIRNDKAITGYISNLENYGRVFFKMNHTDIINKELKMVLLRKNITPFNIPKGETPENRNTIIYETGISSLK